MTEPWPDGGYAWTERFAQELEKLGQKTENLPIIDEETPCGDCLHSAKRHLSTYCQSFRGGGKQCTCPGFMDPTGIRWVMTHNGPVEKGSAF